VTNILIRAAIPAMAPHFQVWHAQAAIRHDFLSSRLTNQFQEKLKSLMNPQFGFSYETAKICGISKHEKSFCNCHLKYFACGQS
jgi:hypothetical protein